MNIKEQATLAKEATAKIAKYIININSKLNKDGRGCYINSININYGTDVSSFTIGFKSSETIDSPVSNFECREVIYD